MRDSSGTGVVRLVAKVSLVSLHPHHTTLCLDQLGIGALKPRDGHLFRVVPFKAARSKRESYLICPASTGVADSFIGVTRFPPSIYIHSEGLVRVVASSAHQFHQVSSNLRKFEREAQQHPPAVGLEPEDEGT